MASSVTQPVVKVRLKCIVMEQLLSRVSGFSACAIPLRCSEYAPGTEASCVPVSFSVAALVASSASLIASVPPSLALKYDDVVSKAGNVVTSSSGDGAGLVEIVSSNPVAVVAGVAAVAVPLIALRASASGQSFGSVSAAAAFAKLSDSEQNAQLLDIRAPEEIRAAGAPNLKSLRKKALQVAYDAEDASFVAKVVARCRNPEATTLFVLDRLDGESLAVAKLLANNGFQKAYAVKGGVEGPDGWQGSELPWLLPRKSFSLNLDGLKNLLNGSQDNAKLVPATLGVAAAAGIGVAIFTEAETVLQLLGSAAFIQIFAKKFMFADDREKSIKEIQTFLDTKIAPKEIVEELKDVGRILLPKDGEVDAAVASGSAVLEKKLKVDSVAPANGAQIRDAGAA